MDTDAITDGQDGLPGGDAPSGSNPDVPSTSPAMVTKEEAERLANERHAKLDKRINELERMSSSAKTALLEAEKRAQAAEDELAKSQKAKEEAEYEAVRGNPDALSLYERTRNLREAEARVKKTEAELRRREIENESAIKDAQTHRVYVAAKEIADKYNGVNPDDLIELTDGTPEKMEKMAAKLGSIAKPKQDNQTPFTPDSGGGQGGVVNPTADQLANMSNEAYFAWAKKREEIHHL